MAKKDKKEKLEKIIEEVKEEGVKVEVIEAAAASGVVDAIVPGFEPPRKKG